MPEKPKRIYRSPVAVAQSDTRRRPTSTEILQTALQKFQPVATFVGFSGGRDSLVCTHWMMQNAPGCQVFHCNTGIGIERTRKFVRDTCKRYGWPLHEIRALEDCGQDYDAIVKKYGFPGPLGHGLMYARLKERAIDLLVRRHKTKKFDRVVLATGIRHDESIRRMRYTGREVTKDGSQIWVNPIYWMEKQARDEYIAAHKLPINPISEILGMSGECLCGAFAHPGELELVRKACPATAKRIDRLQAEVSKIHPWGWEQKPPALSKREKIAKQLAAGPLCAGCIKSAIVKREL